MTHTPTAPSATPADRGAAEPPARFAATAQRLGELTDRKHVAYGRSLERVGPVLALLTADTPAERWRDPHFLADVQVVTRILEKFCRVLGPEPLAFGEQPWDDAAGYALARATLCAEHAGQEAEREAARQAVRDFTQRRASAPAQASAPADPAPLRAEDTLRTLPGFLQAYQNATQPASEITSGAGDGFDRASPAPLPSLGDTLASPHLNLNANNGARAVQNWAATHLPPDLARDAEQPAQHVGALPTEATHPGIDLNPAFTPDQGAPLHAVREGVLAGLGAIRGGPHADILCASPELAPYLQPSGAPHEAPRAPFGFPVVQAAQALAALRPDLAPADAPGQAD